MRTFSFNALFTLGFLNHCSQLTQKEAWKPLLVLLHMCLLGRMGRPLWQISDRRAHDLLLFIFPFKALIRHDQANSYTCFLYVVLDRDIKSI